MPESPNFPAMASELREAGYIVFKATCDKMDRPHGRHVLMTRSAVCEGTDDAPHGYRGSHFGTFGVWVDCKCGHSFADYGSEGQPTNWETHKIEQGIADG